MAEGHTHIDAAFVAEQTDLPPLADSSCAAPACCCRHCSRFQEHREALRRIGGEPSVQPQLNMTAGLFLKAAADTSSYINTTCVSTNIFNKH